LAATSGQVNGSDTGAQFFSNMFEGKRRWIRLAWQLLVHRKQIALRN
jgi:hypothetical protein